MSATETTYPEHERMAAVADESQAIGEFLEWLQGAGMEICVMTDSRLMPWQPARRSITQLLADYQGIDLNQIEAEKRAMIAGLRAARAA